jgi:hypothetical protein
MNEADYRYDVYVSTCDEDADWAEEWLRPRLEAAGLRVGSESDFDLGVARVVNIERAVTGSRNTLLILYILLYLSFCPLRAQKPRYYQIRAPGYAAPSIPRSRSSSARSSASSRLYSSVSANGRVRRSTHSSSA